MAAVCEPMPEWLNQLRQENITDPWLSGLRQRIRKGEARSEYTMNNEFTFYDTRFCLGPTSDLIPTVMTELHNSRQGGHAGYFRTLQKIKTRFFWIGMNRRIKEFVAACVTCQQTKILPVRPLGLLQPLPIPEAIWEEISMDFVTGLPLVKGKSVIIVVVDRLSKYCHLGSLSATYTAVSVAEFFVEHIVRLHGIPTKIVSDRDRVFLSKFWKELFSRSGMTLCMSTAYHPETDGQTEIVNKTIEGYLRSTIADNPRQWIELLPWVELWYNTTYHHGIGTSLFQLVYGRPPPIMATYILGDSRVEGIEKEFETISGKNEEIRCSEANTIRIQHRRMGMGETATPQATISQSPQLRKTQQTILQAVSYNGEIKRGGLSFELTRA